MIDNDVIFDTLNETPSKARHNEKVSLFRYHHDMKKSDPFAMGSHAIYRTWSMALLSGLLLLGGCGDDRFPDYHYKMTIYVATPEGEKSFSSVRAVQQEEVNSIQSSSERAVKTKVQGEAVIIDLPSGRTVYALIGTGAQTAYPALSPFVPIPGRDPRFDDLSSNPTEGLDKLAAQQQAMVKIVGPKDLPRTVANNPSHRTDYAPTNLWPMLVTFEDPRDPKTVREVSPESIGVKRITIEVTEEPVTTGVEDGLPSFGPEMGFKQWVRSLQMGDPRLNILSGFYRRDGK